MLNFMSEAITERLCVSTTMLQSVKCYLNHHAVLSVPHATHSK